MAIAIQQLIDAGDWACSFADSEGLCQVCEQLAQRLHSSPALAEALRRAARDSASDMCAATRQWAQVSSQIAHHSNTVQQR